MWMNKYDNNTVLHISDEMFQLKVGPKVNETVLNKLRKYSDYAIELVAFNRIGSGLQSQTIQVKTDEDGNLNYFPLSISF